MHAPRPPGPIVDLTRERWIYYRFRRPGERPAWPTRSSGRMAQPPSPRTAPSSEEGLRGAFSSPYSSSRGIVWASRSSSFAARCRGPLPAWLSSLGGISVPNASAPCLPM
ncbi:unnamed protein product [Prorocentrum cordatum]|uniref:Uncharacterized protein n=1 Tax=Prorocentrum cordatum TaxID=2364126 RepID=A0ABN9VPI9_9DINO|nr:unnamed protein product [Polarella glacialis]